MKTTPISRRQFLGNTALTAAGFMFLSKSSFANSFVGKPNSVVGGVQIGVITYSFRSMPGT
ncbi:MAG: twin-arginine translocation signal domain-containing protein, partial [Chitinophagaceae bacterium]